MAGNGRVFVVQLGHVLRIERQSRDWSQARVAKAARVSRQTVNSIELARTPDPSIVTCRRLAKVFDKTLGDVLAMVEAGL